MMNSGAHGELIDIWGEALARCRWAMVSRENRSTCASECHRGDGGKNPLGAEMACPGEKCPKNVNFAQFFVEILRIITTIIVIIWKSVLAKLCFSKTLAQFFSTFLTWLCCTRRDKRFASSYMFNEELCCFIKFLLCPRRNFMHNSSEFIWMFWSVRPEIFPNIFFFIPSLFFSRISCFTQSLMYSVGKKKRFLCVRTTAEHQRSDGDLSLKSDSELCGRCKHSIHNSDLLKWTDFGKSRQIYYSFI